MTNKPTDDYSGLIATERILVPFAGEGSGVEELSWGQWEIWLAMRDQESALAIGGSRPLTGGETVESVAGELSWLVSRYQTMRTLLRFDAAGRPLQAVSAAGEIALEIYDAADGDPAALADAVHAKYEFTPFDYTGEWPVRMAVVRQHGELTHMAVAMCHMVADGAGSMVMLREVLARPTTPVEGAQPLEQARWQRSEAGQRQNRKAVRYWENLLRTIPARRLGGDGDEQVPRHWQGQLTSPALLLAVRSICDQTRADSSPVLLAMFAVALARINGINPVVTRVIVSNRFRAGLSDVVCMLAQNGLVSLDVADISIDEAILRAQRGAMTAYKYAYFDAEEVAALIARVTEERAPDFNIGSFFNDRRVAHRDVGSGAATPWQIEAALPETAFAWIRKQHNPVERMFVHIDDVPDVVRITLDIDTAFVSPAEAEALLRGVEAVAVEAACDLATPTRIELMAAGVR